jgi:hypothetical protein
MRGKTWCGDVSGLPDALLNPSWRSVWILTCKSILKAEYRGERLIDASSRVRPTGGFGPCADAVTPEGYGC